MAGPTTNRIGGVLALTVDGAVFEARGNFQVTGPSVKRTGIAGQDGVHGYTEEPIVPQIKGDVSIGHQLSIFDLEQNITDSTVMVQLANGMNYVLSDAWVTSAFVLDAHDGKIDVTFEGLSLQELVAQ
jgi:hypothetical protein